MEWKLLAGVPAEQVRELLQVARRRRFGRHEVVFHRDDPADSLHLVVGGRFAIRQTSPLGDAVTIAIRGPGASFGEMALVAEEPRRNATVAALEEAETLALHRGDFEQVCARHPGVTRLLLQFTTAEVRFLNDRLLEALYVPVDKRVRRRLVELAAVYPAVDGVTTISLTQEVVAELAGASRSTVNQILRAEAAAGRIELSRGRIRILDAAQLERRAR